MYMYMAFSNFQFELCTIVNNSKKKKKLGNFQLNENKKQEILYITCLFVYITVGG